MGSGSRILVVGGGAREHALLWKLAQSPHAAALLCAPGNAGTTDLAESIPVRANDVEGIVAAAEQARIDLVVVGPEEPLSLGLSDRLRERGFRVCGPSQAAARIESSKSWAKEIMAEAGVPTARSVVVRDFIAGLAALSEFDFPVVIKADGLAAGKGVVIAANRVEASQVMTAFLEDAALGPAGQTVVIEEFLEGVEVSVFGLTDGQTVLPLPPSCDYKRVFEGDRGPNTGGMGAYAPTSQVNDAQLDWIRSSLLEPTVRSLAARGFPFSGILYAGLILTSQGPKVLEFNARFGDPETQVVLPILDGDLVELLGAIADGTLKDATPPLPPNRAAVGIVLASGGYPGPYATGIPIAGLEDVPDDAIVFHAGTRRDADARVLTAGGRVLTVVGTGPNLASARERAYAGAAPISFQGRHQRTDIARRELPTT